MRRRGCVVRPPGGPSWLETMSRSSSPVLCGSPPRRWTTRFVLIDSSQITGRMSMANTASTGATA